MILLELNKIYVIESLLEREEKTGESLFNDTIRRRLEFQGLNNNCELIKVGSKNEFFQALEHVRQEVIFRLVNPVLHFEMHGSIRGLEFNNGEFASWQELQFRLVELNVISEGNLFITIASCYGGYIFNAIRPNSRIPFWGFVGPFEEVITEEILSNFTAFYDEFLTSQNLLEAVKALNLANEKGYSKFYFYNTEDVFNRSYENYEKKYLTPEVISDRLESGLEEARQHTDVSHLSDEDIKKILKYYIVDKKDLLKETLMTKFLLWDLFPDRKPK